MVKAKVDLIKQLRILTSAPVVACKKALEESGGDLKKAQAKLKKKGLARVAKKKGEAAKEGLIHCYLHSNGKIGAMVKLACQTDFVAKNRQFERLAHEICLQIAAMNPKTVKVLLKQEYIRDPQKTIGDLLNEAIAKFGENIKIEAFERLEI